MSFRFNRDSLDLRAVCSLMGVQVDSGIVNRANKLREAGAIHGGCTYGQMYRIILADMLRDSLVMDAEISEN